MEAMMTQGNTRYIEYISGAGEQWRAHLNDMSGVFPSGVSDPTFHHEGPGGQSHDDEWINYKAQDGNYWWSKCHSHSSLLGSSDYSFTFEHFHERDGDPDHEDSIIGFFAWDGSKWVASVPDTSNSSNLQFNANPKVLS
jgi:hypothetical protein